MTAQHKTMEKVYQICSGPRGHMDTETLTGDTPEECLLDYFHHHRDDDEVSLSLAEWLEKHDICIYICNADGDIVTELIKY